MLRAPAKKNTDNPAVPYEQCLAKTIEVGQGQDREIKAGKGVFEHCAETGLVCQALLESMGECRRRLFPEGTDLLCAIHDIGKISPLFLCKLLKHMGVDPAQRFAQLKPYARSEGDSTTGYHANVGAIAVEAITGSKELAAVVAQHHGSLRLSGEDFSVNSEILGGKTWQQERERLLAALQDYFHCSLPLGLKDWQVAILAGLTCTADWIASGSLRSSPEQIADAESIKQCVKALGFKSYEVKTGLSFEQVFGFKPREAQEVLINAVTGPGVHVFEAPMGYGKTEAAFYAAYKMLAGGRADGVYFALPTQLTSEKIHERLTRFLERVIADPLEEISPLLLHSKAWLRSAMGAEATPGHSWFAPSKRGLLFPFAAGTIDQALTSVMNVKHGFVRAFGLCGKVIIIDEVHSYDIYTGTLVEALVKQSRELGCTVIILSATLTGARRESLIGPGEGKSAYPLISARRWVEDRAREYTLQGEVENAQVAVIEAVRASCLQEALQRAGRGEQVLWIENTVNQAQQTYEKVKQLTAATDIEIGLLHSRFTPYDRTKNEAHWLSLYGPQATNRGERGRILVGTQVVEESVDLDADFLISDFAPTDMLLQRTGRLWRHKQTARPQGCRRELWVIKPETTEKGEFSFGNSEKIYEPYVLHRSYEIWQGIFSSGVLTLPQDIRGMIEQTYQERAESDPQMKDYKRRLDERREKMKSAANFAQAKGATVTQDDEGGPCTTRYITRGTVTCLVLGEFNIGEQETFIKLVDGTELRLETGDDSDGENIDMTRRERAEKAAALMQHCVACPDYYVNGKGFEAVSYAVYKKSGLKKHLYVNFGKNSVICKLLTMMYDSKSQIAYARQTFTKTDGGQEATAPRLEYSAELGLRFYAKDGEQI